jgi:hypothetical protein
MTVAFTTMLHWDHVPVYMMEMAWHVVHLDDHRTNRNNQIYYLLTFNFKKVSHKTWNIQYDLYCLHDMLLQDSQNVNTYKMDMLELGECYYFIITSKTQCQLLQPQLLRQKCLLVAGVCEKISSHTYNMTLWSVTHVQYDSLKCHTQKKRTATKYFWCFKVQLNLAMTSDYVTPRDEVSSILWCHLIYLLVNSFTVTLYAKVQL